MSERPIDDSGLRRVLLVGDDPAEVDAMVAIVARAGLDIRTCSTLAAARMEIADFRPHLVLSDIDCPDGSGLELLDPEAPAPAPEIVYITGATTRRAAVTALELGALDYLTKPVDVDRLEHILGDFAPNSPIVALRSNVLADVSTNGAFKALVGRSPPMLRVLQQVMRVAPTAATVLIQGATGTGKELIAHMVHDLSSRRIGPFVALNCGAIPVDLIESELFGHEKGSFTGASRRHVGAFERAQGGTLFLDEITEMSSSAQVKLLRVLESREFQRVGGDDPVPCNARIVAATNVSPTVAVENGSLREDLFYRLAVFPLFLPPLDARGDDVVLIARRVLEHFGLEHGRIKTLSDAAVTALKNMSFPGNVRELRNAIQRAYILADDEIEPEHLTRGEKPNPPAAVGQLATEVRVPLGSSIAEGEKQLILATLANESDDKLAAARVLGISVKTLYTRLKVYDAQSGARGPD